jgi:retinol dehydrogenase 12
MQNRDMADGNSKEKVMLVTGATGGIGFVTARELARAGTIVVGVGRSAERCSAAEQEIRRATGNPNVTYLLADLSSQADIRRLFDQFKERYHRLDVLVNNAGGYFVKHQLSPDGIELSLAINHLSYFLLTNLLVDLLKASAPSRVVSVSSGAHLAAHLDFNDLQNQRRYQGFKVYGQTKLMNLLFTYELARRMQGSGVTANALHPGFVATNFAKNNGGFMKFGMGLAKFVALTPERGAATTIYLATSPEVEGVSGKYFNHKKAVSSSSQSYDLDAARRLWQISAEMTGMQEAVQ